MFDAPPSLRVTAAVGLALLTLASDHLATQGRMDGGTRPTTIVDGREAVEGEVLVRYRTGSGVIERQRAEFQVDSDEMEMVGRRGARRMRSRRLGTQAMLQALRENPDVEYAEPNYIVRAVLTPNDPSFGNLWGLFNAGQAILGSTGVAGADIDMPLAWQYTVGTRTAVVGVIDSGVDYNHQDLAANMWTAPRAFSVNVGGATIFCAAGTHGFNAINNTCDPMDDHSHGTHVAGTIGAVGNNGIGVAGVNWYASMMGLKFLNAAGSGSTSNAIKAIEFAIQAKAVLGADANVRILSNSWGGGGYSTALANQIEAANTADMLFVAAAGNDGLNNDVYPHYPSSYTNANVVSVASTTNRDQRSSFSNYGGVSVDLGAPGSSTLSTVPNNGYAYYSGTSMATPHVSGVAALVLGVCPVSAAALKAALLYRVDLIPAMSGITTTGGRLNAYGALVTCQPPTLTVNTPTVVPGQTMQLSVQNAFPRTTDWIGVYRTSAVADANFADWFYLNGLKTAPVSASVTSTTHYPAPALAAGYQLRLFSNGYTRLATAAVTVMQPPSLAINDVSVTEGVSGTALATFTVTLDRSWANNVTVGYATADGSASAGSDFAATSGTLTIPAYQLSGTISVPVSGDSTAEPTEYFVVNLSSPINGVIGDGQGVGTIVTDEVPPAATIAASASVAPSSPISVTVANGPGLPRDWIGVYASSSAPDTDMIDWVYLNGLRTAPSSGLSNTTLHLAGPAMTGTYFLRVFTNGYTRVATSAPVVVSPLPVLRVSDTTLVEGNSGTTAAAVVVTLTPASAQPVTVAYSTSNVTAASGSDYAAITGTLTFPPSATSQFVSILIDGDTAIEPTETFVVNLSNATNATITKAQGVVTIVTDDAAPAPSIATGSTVIAPGGMLSAVVANGPGVARDWIGVYPSTSAGDAEFIDWIYLNGQKSAPSVGVSNATVQFPAPAVAGSYYLRLFTGGYTRLATSGQITVAPMPLLTINDVAVQEGNLGTVTAIFTVTLNPVSAQTVAVDYATANLTAASGTDYVAASGAITFAPSVATQTISVTINGDTAIEPTETFAVNLSNASNASLADLQGVGTITTDDLPPGPSLTVGASPVAPGVLVSAMVDNGPGSPRDWIALYNPADADGSFIDWWFLNGTKTAPVSGVSSATVQLRAPATAGTYQLRFFTTGYTRLATANVVVSGLPGSAPVLGVMPFAPPGVPINASVNNGPGLARDWIGVFLPGSDDYSFTDWVYLNGQKTPPASGLSNTQLQVPRPQAPGTYELRLFTNGYTKVVTSTTVIILP